MKFLANIPRGLVIFIVGIACLVAAAVGYRLLAGGTAANGTGGGNSNGLFSALFPFGGGSPGQSSPGAATSSAPLTGIPGGQVPLLREVSADPVSGGWFAPGQTATSAPAIRYMTRANGYITETPANSFDTARASNTTLTGIEELYPAGDSTLVVRSLNANGGIVNAFGTVHASTSTPSFITSPLPPFARVAVERGGDMLSVVEQNGGSDVVLSKPDGSHASLELASPIASWVPLIGGDAAFVETAPTAAAPGYLYEIVKGALSEVGGGMLGMTALIDPSGRYAAISGNGADGFSLSVTDLQTGQSYPTPVRTTTLKCAWIPPAVPLLFCAVPVNPPTASYPDDWLLGTVSFADQAWVVDPVKNTAYFIGNLADKNGQALDAERIAVDPSGSYALFMNKNDLSLWSLNIADAVMRARAQR